MKMRISKIVKGALFSILALVSLGALACAWLSYSGRSEWAKTRDELIARGEKLSYVDLAPPEIPPEENFFADPLWEQLTTDLPKADRQLEQLVRDMTDAEIAKLEADYPEFAPIKKGSALQILDKHKQSTDAEFSTPSVREAAFILAALEYVRPTLLHMEELSKRTSARFPIRYEDGLSAALEHFGYLFKASKILRLRAIAHLANAQSSAAVDDILLIIRLADSLSSEPLLVSALVRASIYSDAVDVIHRGVQSFPVAELSRIKPALSEVNLTSALVQGMRGERAFLNDFIDTFREKPAEALQLFDSVAESSHPQIKLLSGIYSLAFIDKDRAFGNRYFQMMIDSLEKDAPRLAPARHREIENRELLPRKTNWDRVRHLITVTTLPAFGGVGEKLAYAQNGIHQATMACALQQWAYKHKQLPESVDPLVPDYLPAIPIDIVTGGPMKYRKTAADSFLLWSVGSNEQDEEGVAAEKRDQGDWVWKGKVSLNP